MVYKIITTSSLIPRNGLDTLIKACRLLTFDFELAIAGSGREESNLKKLAQGLPVKFLGRVPNKQVPNLLMTSDLFVRPSRFEGFGNSFIEAMAAGLPIIGTPVGGITDFLVDSQTGLMVPVDDPLKLAQAITRLAKDRKLALKLSQNGRKLVKEQYTWDIVAKKVWTEWQKLTTPTA